jgi:hypothetical protein
MKELLRKIHNIPSRELVDLNKTFKYAHEDCNEDPYLLADLFNDYIRDYFTCKEHARHLDCYSVDGLEQIIQKYQLA